MKERLPLEERARRGAEQKAELIAQVGFVPLSILNIRRGRLHRSLYHLAQERLGVAGAARGSIRRIDSLQSEEARLNALQRKQAGMFIAPYQGSQNREAASVMAAELVDFAIRYYLPRDESGALRGTYLDPFSAQGVQAQVSALRGIDYFGVDLAEEYVAFTEAALAKYELAAGQRVEVRRGDSTQTPEWIEDGIGDLSFTSPPYWDVEFYSDDPEQIGDRSYPEFIAELGAVYAAWRPKFREGATVVVNVSDIRRQGRFYPFHADAIGVIAEQGYEPTDLWVLTGLGGGLSKVYAVQKNRETRHAPRVHEYLLCFEAR